MVVVIGVSYVEIIRAIKYFVIILSGYELIYRQHSKSSVEIFMKFDIVITNVMNQNAIYFYPIKWRGSSETRDSSELYQCLTHHHENFHIHIYSEIVWKVVIKTLTIEKIGTTSAKPANIFL